MQIALLEHTLIQTYQSATYRTQITLGLRPDKEHAICLTRCATDERRVRYTTRQWHRNLGVASFATMFATMTDVMSNDRSLFLKLFGFVTHRYMCVVLLIRTLCLKTTFSQSVGEVCGPRWFIFQCRLAEDHDYANAANMYFYLAGQQYLTVHSRPGCHRSLRVDAIIVQG